jgi:hypothetical protein
MPNKDSTDLLCRGDDDYPGCKQPIIRFMRKAAYALHGAVILKVDQDRQLTVRCERDGCGSITITRGHGARVRHLLLTDLAIPREAPASIRASIRDLGLPSTMEEMLEIMQQRWDNFRMTKVRQRGTIAVGLRFDVFNRDGFRCRYCGVSIDDGAILHADHVIPESKGGPTTMENLVTACLDCNLGKSNKDLKREKTAIG